MKYTKIVALGIITILFCSSFAPASKHTEGTFIEVYFTNKLTVSDLAQIQSNLAAKHILLNYDYLKFGKDGKLIGIQYDVTVGKAGGADETNDTSVAIGFIINTSENPKYDIIVGRKDDIKNEDFSLKPGNNIADGSQAVNPEICKN